MLRCPVDRPIIITSPSHMYEEALILTMYHPGNVWWLCSSGTHVPRIKCFLGWGAGRKRGLTNSSLFWGTLSLVQVLAGG